jgi:hypothetical protein
MAYKILNPDGTILLLLADNKVDQSATSLSLVGKSVNAYGPYINNNFVTLLSNSANVTSSPPRSPLTGQLWYDTTVRRLKVYDGSFKPASGAIVASSAPLEPSVGDLWFNSSTLQLHAWEGTRWTTVGPTFPFSVGENGWIVTPDPVRDSEFNIQKVTLLKNYGETLGILSPASFTTTYFTTSTTLLNSPVTPVIKGITVFGSVQATDRIISTNGITTDNITSQTINIRGSSTSTTTTTGALTIVGGAGIGGNLYVGNLINSTNVNVVSTATISNVVISNSLNLSNNRITNVASPINPQDVVTKDFLYRRNLTLSMDVSDGISNTGISGWLEQVAPVNEYFTGTIARILCSSLTNTSTSVSIDSLISVTTGSFLTSTTEASSALTGISISTATIPAQSVLITRSVKTFQHNGTTWSFVS